MEGDEATGQVQPGAVPVTAFCSTHCVPSQLETRGLAPDRAPNHASALQSFFPFADFCGCMKGIGPARATPQGWATSQELRRGHPPGTAKGRANYSLLHGHR